MIGTEAQRAMGNGQGFTHCALLIASLVLYLVGLQPFLFAATYYVAKTGSDGNSGAADDPWLTVQKAANTVAAGDTVNVGDGTYSEIVKTKTAGTAGAPITFKGSGNA